MTCRNVQTDQRMPDIANTAANGKPSVDKKAYRDDFIAICEERSRFDMKDCFAKFNKEIKKYSNGHDKELKIKVSKGSATYSKDKYDSYRSVFPDANAECDKKKPSSAEKHSSGINARRMMNDLFKYRYHRTACPAHNQL